LTPFTDTLLAAIGLTRLPEAIDFLIQLVAENPASAEAALEALTWARADEEIRSRLEAAVERTGSQQLRRLYKKHFD
ncbi:MAG: hypothetical protein GY953_14735, partial [bacterium]|nr:hypothetical protein [bacterium]